MFICAIVMIVGAVLFFWRAFTAEEPIVDLRAFSNVNFAFGSLFSFVIGIGLYGLTYLYPVFLGRIRGYDSMMIGEALFVSGLAMFVTAPISGILSSKMDLRIMMMIGFVRLRRRHLVDDASDRRLGFLGIADPADPARLFDDAVHGADQQHRARHLAAGPAEERVGPVQPDPQSRRRRRPCRHQHRADRPQCLPLREACRACGMGQCGGAAEAAEHDAQLPADRQASTPPRRRSPNCRAWSSSRRRCCPSWTCSPC